MENLLTPDRMNSARRRTSVRNLGLQAISFRALSAGDPILTTPRSFATQESAHHAHRLKSTETQAIRGFLQHDTQ